MRERKTVRFVSTILFLVIFSSTSFAGTPWKFVVVADSRDNGADINGVNTVMLSEIATEIVNQGVDFVMFPGDLVNGYTDAATLEHQFTVWRDTMQPVYDANIGVYPVRGNHDVGSTAAWNNVFSGSYAMPGNGPAGEENMTYSVVHKNALILGLDQYDGVNNNLSYHRVNQAWINAQFAANNKAHIFVFGHETAFKAQHADCLDDYPTNRNTFWGSIKNARGRTYFTAHDHFYNHALVDDNDGDPNNDIHQYIVGTAGAPLYSWAGSYNGDNSGMTVTQQYYAKEYGYVLGEVDGLNVTLTWMERISAGTYTAKEVWSYVAVPVSEELAWNPSPVPYTTDVDRNVVLSWTPGAYAVKHDVYFGTNEISVADANDPNTLPGRGRQDANSYAISNLALGQTYYWRIDEVNDANIDSPWKGKVWSFTTISYLIVDDFEDYNGLVGSGTNVFNTWADGRDEPHSSGSEIFLEQDPPGGTIHTGAQAMKYVYDNDGIYGQSGSSAPYYSEIEANAADLDVGQDWTTAGVKALDLWFYGTADNDANEQMYVALKDTDSNIAVVPYGGDANDVRNEAWQVWQIDLSTFSGVNLAGVEKVYIGFGDRDNPVQGGSGTVYFDDISLFPSRCFPEYVAASFNDDCMVDFKDLETMIGNWLNSGYTVPVTEPNDPCGWWKLDETSGSTAADSSVNGHTGTLNNMEDSDWVIGKISNALQFDGVDENVLVTDCNGITGTNPRTVSVWVKLAAAAENESFNDIVAWGTGSYRGAKWLLTLNYGVPFLEFAAGSTKGDVIVTDDQWHHIAAVAPADANNYDIQIYVDGRLNVNSYSRNPAINTDPDGTVSIGYFAYYYEGLIDDVRIYDYALSETEVVYLATEGTGYYKLDPRTANLYEDEQIDFKDFAVLSDKWLEEQLWP